MSILPLVGSTVFEKPKKRPIRREKLRVVAVTKGIEAHGIDAPEGFIVLEGSKAAPDEVKSIHPYLTNLRRDLQRQNVLVPRDGHLVFMQDYTFNSPSTAAGVVLGRSANGRISHSFALDRPPERQWGDVGSG